jgi:hypothetical protein
VAQRPKGPGAALQAEGAKRVRRGRGVGGGGMGGRLRAEEQAGRQERPKRREKNTKTVG